MATLYVENVPDELYQALRDQAKSHRRSVAQEVIGLLEDHVPTPTELERRRELYRKALAMSSRPPLTPGSYPSTAELQRQGREAREMQVESRD